MERDRKTESGTGRNREGRETEREIETDRNRHGERRSEKERGIKIQTA
jgi:hypothetical protein